PSLKDSAAPCAPNSTLSTAWVSETQTQTTSAPPAASAGELAARAPSTFLPGVRFHTDTSCPAFTRFSAMGRPMIPRPKNATRMLTPQLNSIRTDLGNGGQAIAVQSFKILFAPEPLRTAERQT